MLSELELIRQLDMPSIKALGLRGRLRKRLRKGPIDESTRKSIARQWPGLFSPNLKEAICYVIGKHLYYKKEKQLLTIDKVNRTEV